MADPEHVALVKSGAEAIKDWRQNKGFGEWGELLGDSVIAAAILDRLLHHSHVLNIRGESYRLAEKRTAGLLGGATPLPLQAVTTLSSPGNPAKDQGVGQN